jgi:short-subunit dehydrogenase
MPLAPEASRTRIALITGASGGLGAEIARALVAAGKSHALALTARRADRLASLAAELRQADPQVEVLTIACDLIEPEVPMRVIAATKERFGRLDLLVNNAGLGLPTLFADADPELLRRQIALNFTVPLLLARMALPNLLRSKGMIINIGSAITTIPNSALGAYGATKAGLAYWNDALRRELKSQGVRVCLVEPGPIGTEFSEAFGHLVEPGEHAHPVFESPSAWMVVDAADAAGRIVGLIDRPRRRLSIGRRIVWPMRAVGTALRLWPSLGDYFVTYWYGVDHATKSPEEIAR